MKHGRYRQLLRCLRLQRIVRAGGDLSLNMLAARLGVCTRTVRRDLAALRAAGEKLPQFFEKDIAA